MTDTLRAPPSQSRRLSHLIEKPADALLALIDAYRRDPRDGKIDVGVGVYRDAAGNTPVLRAVKAAEHVLLTGQTSKSYLGPEGDVGYFEALRPLVIGDAVDSGHVVGLQTPGGTGALRLALELVATANAHARVLIGTPTWPNHAPIAAAAGLAVETYPFFDVRMQHIDLDAMLAAFGRARPGDVALLHGCCHNPTGADLDADQWRAVADAIAKAGLIPLIDLAYHGLGGGMEADVAGTRAMLRAVPEALVAYSCDKNFGLYRERVGALFVTAPEARGAAAIQSNLLALARANWSMPPDHGAAIVRVVLEDTALTADWRVELDAMRTRIRSVRDALAAIDPWFAPLAGQKGMFSTLPLSPDQVRSARDGFGVYMAGSGRINIAGLTDANIPPFAQAIAAVR